MEPMSHDTLSCRVCGRRLESDNRFCPSCGTPTGLAVPVVEPDPSTLETRKFPTQPEPSGTHWSSAAPESEAQLWGTPETTVAPETGNRTLWIILGIIAMIVLVCCCILPLGITIISGVDYNFQQEIRTF